ncbi:MAG: hypothetical protein ACNA8K_13015 [Cyclonatronaceae bacterium]
MVFLRQADANISQNKATLSGYGLYGWEMTGFLSLSAKVPFKTGADFGDWTWVCHGIVDAESTVIIEDPVSIGHQPGADIVQ